MSQILSIMIANLIVGIILMLLYCWYIGRTDTDFKPRVLNNAVDTAKVDLSGDNKQIAKNRSISKKQQLEVENKHIITFKDVAGHKEAKKDLQSLVQFMKYPERYMNMGAKLPKGVILYGNPGNGKTLMAKAVAGEAGVSFIAASGSDFVEKYVGVGAKRVRKLFEEAKKNAPCIVFIDEIDAVGAKRDGDNSERNQTLNALLTELDGFHEREKILVIAATNRIDMLDNALIRPGRFDRHVAIPSPSYQDRMDLIRLYTKNKNLSRDVSLSEIADITEGFSCSEIENLLNESAVLAVNSNKKIISMDDINNALFKIITKGNRAEVNNENIRTVAYHEAGHALCAKLLTNLSVSRVTCIPSTSGIQGLTIIAPDGKSIPNKEDLINRIMINYAGRAAEYLLTQDENKITIGASDDIKSATKIIMSMIEEYGMHEKAGLLNLSNLNYEKKNEYAKELSDGLYKKTVKLLSDNYDALFRVAESLNIKRTLSEEDLDRLIGKNAIKYNDKHRMIVDIIA